MSSASSPGNQQRQHRSVHRSATHSLQGNAMSGRSHARYAISFSHRVPVSLGPVVHLASAPPGLVCGLAACSPSSATASSACRGPASHVSPESLYVTQRFNTVPSLSFPSHNLVFCTNSSFSFSFCDNQSRSSPSPATVKSSTCKTMFKSRDVCVRTHMDN